jgi:hypothetical protein
MSKNKLVSKEAYELQSQVLKNRKSLLEKDKPVCTICIEEVVEAKEARINGCSHKFCFECINSWAQKCSNTCPNCKKKFTEIIYKDVCLNDQKVQVKDKNEICEEDFSFECEICDE